MKNVMFYHKDTGLFSRVKLMVSDDEAVALNTPADHVAIPGHHHDALCQRVDVSTGEVVDYVPPQPSADHAWSTTERRWQVKPEVLERQAARNAALYRIQQLEHQSMRPLREAVITGNKDAYARLVAIEDEINMARKELQ